MGKAISERERAVETEGRKFGGVIVATVARVVEQLNFRHMVGAGACKMGKRLGDRERAVARLRKNKPLGSMYVAGTVRVADTSVEEDGDLVDARNIVRSSDGERRRRAWSIEIDAGW